jgi:AcrR family transcriptional regulator
MNETQVKILDTAERLFGEQGYAATSLRHIVAEAGVNLAAIHYHFGSKEDLLHQLVMRKAKPVNEERMALLDRFESEAGPAPVPVEKILQAFLQPPFQRVNNSPCFVKLMGRMYGEGEMPVIVEKHFQPTVARFFAAFGRALPRLAPQELALRVQFLVGAMAHTMFAVPQANLPGTQVPNDGALLLSQLIAFLTGGLKAPAALPAAALSERTEEK